MKEDLPKCVLLVVHGMTPKDFPAEKKNEYMRLRRLYHAHGGVSVGEQGVQRCRFETLENEIRNWPRTQENDPFHFASIELGRLLESELMMPVKVGFNEFCSPTVYEALDQIRRTGVREIIVTTPMLTPGGHHSEREIPDILKVWKDLNPDVAVRYAWPFRMEAISEFIGRQILLAENET